MPGSAKARAISAPGAVAASRAHVGGGHRPAPRLDQSRTPVQGGRQRLGVGTARGRQRIAYPLQERDRACQAGDRPRFHGAADATGDAIPAGEHGTHANRGRTSLAVVAEGEIAGRGV